MSKAGIEFKKRLRRGEKLFGTHISLSDFLVTEMAGNHGLDYVWIDTEHSAIDYQEVNMHILAAQAKGLAAIVRVPQTEAFLAKRILEMGPDGIAFPMVGTPGLAKNAMDFSMYPPKGIRGFSPARAWDFGTMGLDQYLSTIDDSLCRLLVIELKEAVDNLEEILKVPYIDGLVIGPMDLSGSIGELGDIRGENTVKLMKAIVEKAGAAKMPVGTGIGSTKTEDIKFFLDLGLQFMAAGGDSHFINNGCRELAATFRNVSNGSIDGRP
jgi:2-dehydro-3-deoxyglucarate aldolase/4-hydroxy-2-oxoheptanedioate aldolase